VRAVLTGVARDASPRVPSWPSLPRRVGPVLEFAARQASGSRTGVRPVGPPYRGTSLKQRGGFGPLDRGRLPGAGQGWPTGPSGHRGTPPEAWAPGCRARLGRHNWSPFMAGAASGSNLAGAGRVSWWRRPRARRAGCRAAGGRIAVTRRGKLPLAMMGLARRCRDPGSKGSLDGVAIVPLLAKRSRTTGQPEA